MGIINPFNHSGKRHVRYSDVVTNRREEIIGYWPLSDHDSNQAVNLVNANASGAYNGVAVNQSRYLRESVPLWDGVSDNVNIYTSALDSVFDGAEGTLMLHCKPAAEIWSDGLERYLFRVVAGALTDLSIKKNTITNQLSFNRQAGITSDTITHSISVYDWLVLFLSWSETADEMKAYVNGGQVGETLTGLGAWSGSLNSLLCNIGASSSTGLLCFSGHIANVALWNTALTLADIQHLS